MWVDSPNQLKCSPTLKWLSGFVSKFKVPHYAQTEININLCEYVSLWFDTDELLIQESDTMNETGEIIWQLLICLFVSFFVAFMCLIKGIKTAGKVKVRYYAIIHSKNKPSLRPKSALNEAKSTLKSARKKCPQWGKECPHWWQKVKKRGPIKYIFIIFYSVCIKLYINAKLRCSSLKWYHICNDDMLMKLATWMTMRQSHKSNVPKLPLSVLNSQQVMINNQTGQASEPWMVYTKKTCTSENTTHNYPPSLEKHRVWVFARFITELLV